MKSLPQKNWNNFFKSGKQCLPIRQYEKSILRKMPRGAKIVDLGCGDGSLGVEANQYNLDYIGIDFSAEALARAAIKLKFSSNVKLIKADINKLIPEQNIANASLVFIRLVLSHIKSRGNLLKYAKKLLRPNGKIFILSSIRPDNMVSQDLKLISLISLVDGEIERLCKKNGLSSKIIAEEHFRNQKLFFRAYMCRMQKF